jgi:ribose transport system permease protein
VPWPVALLLMLVLGMLFGLIHGLLITRMKMQPFVVTLCGLLIYRGVARFYTADATAGFPSASSFPTLEWLTTGGSTACRMLSSPCWWWPRSCLVGAAPLGLRALSLCGRQERGGGALFRHPHQAGDCRGLCHLRRLLTAIAAIFFAMYTRSVSPHPTAISTNSMRLPQRCSAAFRCAAAKGSIVGVVLGAILLQVLQNLVNLLGIPSSLNFAVMGSVILIGVLADTQFAAYRKRRAAKRSVG